MSIINPVYLWQFILYLYMRFENGVRVYAHARKSAHHLVNTSILLLEVYAIYQFHEPLIHAGLSVSLFAWESLIASVE